MPSCSLEDSRYGDGGVQGYCSRRSRASTMLSVVILVNLVFLPLGACGRYEESGKYKAWQQRNALLSRVKSEETIRNGRVYIGINRDCRMKGDWIELAVNGSEIGRFVKQEDDPTSEVLTLRRVLYEIQLRERTNVITIFSSSADRGWELEVKADCGDDLLLVPEGKSEWSIAPYKAEGGVKLR